MRVLSCIVFLCFTLNNYAGNGFRVALQGNQSLAMGHTGVGIVNTAESAYFNPAALPYLKNKLHIATGGFGAFPTTTWRDPDSNDTSSTKNSFFVPFYLYSTYKITDWLSAGLAIYTPFKANTEWEKDWQGSHLVNKVELSSTFIQPVIGLKLSKYFSIGGGPIYSLTSVFLNKNYDRSLVDETNVRSNISFEDNRITNWGWSAGFLFSPTEKLRVGFNYRSEIRIDSENSKATFASFPTATSVNNSVVPFQSEIPLPAELKIGFTYQITKNLLFAFDYNRIFWESLDTIDINFNSNSIENLDIPFNFQNSNAYRFGVQYKAVHYLILRGGIYKEESPNTKGSFSPIYPNADGQGYTSGLTLKVNQHFSIDTSFLFVREKEVRASYDFYSENQDQNAFEGNYLSNLFAFGIGISYKR